MQLFLHSDLEFEKIAAGVDMPEDPNAWAQEVLQQLFKQAPFLSDFSPNVTMDKVEAEKGYGFGHVTITQKTEIQQQAGVSEASKAAGMREIRIPIVIKQNNMCPLDLLITDDSKMMPLTESRLRQAIFRPQAFDVTGKTPGDQSMIGQLYPPYRQNFGFGGGGGTVSTGMGKEGSAFEEFLTEDVIEKDAGLARVRRLAKSLGNRPPEDALSDPRMVAMGYATLKNFRRVSKKNVNQSKYEKTRGFKAHVKDLEGYAKKKQGSVLEQFLAEGLEKDARRVTSTQISQAQQAFPPPPPASGYQAPAIAPVPPAIPSSTKAASVLQAIEPTLRESHLSSFRDALRDPQVKLAYEKNAAATLGSLKLLLEAEPVKLAELDTFVRPTVVQVVRCDNDYTVKTASHKYWNPQVMHLDRGAALQQLGEKIVLAADTAGAVTAAEGADAAPPPEEAAPDSDMQAMGPVTEFGLYKVQTDDGQELIGYAIPNLIDIDGTPVPLTLFTNGSQAAIQADIMGTPVNSDSLELPTGDQPQGYGAFFTQAPEGIQATIPLEISGSFQGPADAEGAQQPGGMQASTFDGREVEVSMQPNLQAVMSVDGKMLIPDYWQWVPLDKAGQVSLVGGEDEAPKEAAARRYFAAVDILSGGSTFSFRGPAVEKLAADSREFLDLDGAMFLLAGLGVEQQYGIQKLGEASSTAAPVQVRIGRYIKTAAEQKKAASARAQAFLARVPDLRRPLFKEAAVITDPAAVDAVLSLGFINSENISAFISYLPEIEASQSKVCELLLASRLGLSNTSESALERTVRATEEVIEGLKTLAFEGAEESN